MSEAKSHISLQKPITFKASTGKTVLASVIIVYLLKWVKFTKKNIPVLSVFRDYQNSDIKTMPDIIHLLLKQLSVMDPSLNNLMETLSLYLKGYLYVYIIFSAILIIQQLFQRDEKLQIQADNSEIGKLDCDNLHQKRLTMIVEKAQESS
ncbi:uncharacterized protein ARMOST_16213 [Armillaria ostoyae]|uniref:Nephrocystin 3-like N-terminal domain-containing protein n=1 Tax=Armillaria ostoyae TaxID=47428 RepID=A0A284RVJ1_ARMOS|nr:uncharacterized protein ARMOST_16213 [Armillaria ostoyae]